MPRSFQSILSLETETRADKVTVVSRPSHAGYTNDTNCLTASCHGVLDNGTLTAVDGWVHSTESGTWTALEKQDIRNQYIMMGVCLKCHDDDSNGKCTTCHTGDQYKLGYNPDPVSLTTPTISGKSKATSVHFGFKHFQALKKNGVTKGGKFCWDCHDPHGDGNIYMIQDKVATASDGKFGIPSSRASVSFTSSVGGSDYAKNTQQSPPYNGICNVCHTNDGKQHYYSTGGDSHNSGRKCTTCHEHRFSDSHASGKSCKDCHRSKPIPRHSGFSLPRDCTKCHSGTVGDRMDITGQMKGASHHVQRDSGEIKNTDCWFCHWESTEEGLIDLNRHAGFNYRTYATTTNGTVDLVVLGPQFRPTEYVTIGTSTIPVTAVEFIASRVTTTLERDEVEKVSVVCLSCHSDQNNDWEPFGDCKTPRQYAWDRQSIASRYTNTGTATWGKYSNRPEYPNVAKKNMVKAFSAHGNATANAGGWSQTEGVDGNMSAINSRNGSRNVQCFDCHSSHGSKLKGVTSSYLTSGGTYSGGNLKETVIKKGGYGLSYTAKARTSGINSYNAGAAQCFDCHETRNAFDPVTNSTGTTPWGYESTFGASAAIMGYKDPPRFGDGVKASTTLWSYRQDRAEIISSHLTLNAGLSTPAGESINGLCTGCHDPHGVSPSLGDEMAYAVPLLKGTWLTSPYKEDIPPGTGDGYSGSSGFYNYSNTWNSSYVRPYPQKSNPQSSGGWRTDRNTFNTVDLSQKANVPDSTYGKISEDAKKFAGLCLRCHTKSSLTDGVNSTNNSNWMSRDRVHESVKGWGSNTEHNYPCSKCHQPHSSGLPRLMQTNCLDYKHRGRQASGGKPWASDVNWNGSYGCENAYGRFPYGWWDNGFSAYRTDVCHGSTKANGTGGQNTTGCPPTEPDLNDQTKWPNNQKWNVLTPW